MGQERFATAINCMDGRVQLPVIDWIKEYTGVDYVDMITEPGVDKILAQGEDEALLKSILTRVEISTDKHHSGFIAIVGHADCAGNPVDKKTHLEHLRKAMATVNAWNPDLEIVGLWVDEQWQVHQV